MSFSRWFSRLPGAVSSSSSTLSYAQQPCSAACSAKSILVRDRKQLWMIVLICWVFFLYSMCDAECTFTPTGEKLKAFNRAGVDASWPWRTSHTAHNAFEDRDEVYSQWSGSFSHPIVKKFRLRTLLQAERQPVWEEAQMTEERGTQKPQKIIFLPSWPPGGGCLHYFLSKAVVSLLPRTGICQWYFRYVVER